jgi:hypothetical protein
MSRKLKFFLYGVLFFVSLVFVSGLFMAWHYQDEVKQLIVSEINKNINTEVSVRNISFSVLRKFPRASVEFRDVLIKVPRDYDHSESHSFSSDTLFTAQNLFLQFNIVDIFRQRYRVTNINARGGVLYLEVNDGQQENYRFWKSSESSAEEFNLDLQDVRLANYRFRFGNHLKGLHIDSDLKRLEMKGDFSQSSYRLKGTVHGINREFRHQELVYSGEQEVTAKVALNVNNDLIGIEEGTIEFAGIRLSASGEYDKGENGAIDINLLGQGLDISSFIRLLPGKNQADLDLYQFNGKFDLEATWSGQISKTRSPSVMAVFSTPKAGVKRKDSGMQLTDIKLNGYYTNGNRQNPETSSVVISSFSSGFGKGSISGKAGISNLSKPAVDFDLKASFLLEELAGFYKPGTILQMAGGINTVLSGNGQLTKFAMPDAGEFSKMKLNGVIEIENGMLEVFEGRYIASLIDGELYFGSKIKTPGLSFNVGSDHFLIAGEIDNGLPWLLGENKTMSITGSLYSKKLDLDNYFYPLSNEKSGDTADSEVLLFPDNLEVNLDFMVDDLNFRTFSSTAFRGKLSYKPYMMVLNAVDFNSMAGNVTGNGVIFQRLNGDFMVQSQLEMQDVDMQKMFLSFNNFGQTFIHGDNLKGRLTGHLGFISEWSRNLQWKSEETVADSKVEIREGELVDFEPMLGLARYIDVSELRHIRFSTLTNEIFIRNKVVNIPQMDINSSAFNIVGSGTHRFDGHFDYRLRVLLSDVLFGRAGNSKPENTKYGIVEDDGLGRTGLHLLVSGTSGDFNVSYDHRTVRDAIKEGIANERNVLRQLLHKEFGWYSSDTTVSESAEKVNTSAPGFRIKWDEEDEKSAPQPRPAETGSPVSKPGETRFKIIWDEGEAP